MFARLLCWVVGHRTSVRYTVSEGQLRCTRCTRILDQWPVLRPEAQHRGRAEREAFWARIDADERPALRRVK